jgi:hypothetical protein
MNNTSALINTLSDLEQIIAHNDAWIHAQGASSEPWLQSLREQQNQLQEHLLALEAAQATAEELAQSLLRTMLDFPEGRPSEQLRLLASTARDSRMADEGKGGFPNIGSGSGHGPVR